MSVLDGPRREVRRILDGGVPQWVTPSEDGGELVLADGRRVEEATATYLPPCDPTKIICVHLNYESRRLEFRAGPLVTPTYFQKPNSALNSHRGVLHRPADCRYLNYEGEIVAVVGRPMRNVAPDDVWDHQAGFAPVGPGLVAGVDIRAATIRTLLNGAVVQEAPVSEMNFGIEYLIADLCRHLTFLPGDMIYTGTPANSRPMQLGDVVEVEVTGVGRLTNTVAESPAPVHRVGHQPTDGDAITR